MGKGFRIAGRVVLGIIAAAVFALVFGYLVMILWNWLMPAIFRLPEIGYWQAFGIVILAKLVFGSVGGHGNGRQPRNRRVRREPGLDRQGPFEEGEGESGGGDWREFFNPYHWERYRDFWRDEGRQAFERYTARSEGRRRNGDDGAASGEDPKKSPSRKKPMKRPKSDTRG